ncbi:MAG: hypothetical protein ACJ8C4_14525 [Gemmataceae bacterium]
MTLATITKTVHRVVLQLVPALILIWVAVVYVDRAWSALAPLDPTPTDGPFQLCNMLRRLDAGELPGRDFPAFHGVGIPWAHWPLYRWFEHWFSDNPDSELFASELARQTLTPVATLLVYALASLALTRSLWPAAIWALLSIMPLPAVLGKVLPLAQLMEAGTSLNGLRGLMPLLAISCLWRSGPLAAGAALGAAWLLGIEQGTYLAIAICATGLFAWQRRKNRPDFDRPALAISLMLGVTIGLAGIAILTWGGQANALRLYFSDIPHDQVWYFGVLPNDYLGSGEPGNQKRVIYIIVAAAIFAVTWIVSIALARRATSPERLSGSLILAVAVAYSGLTLTSSLGIFRPHEFYHLAARVLIMLATAWAYRQLSIWIQKQRLPSQTITTSIAGVVAVGLILFTFRDAISRRNAAATPTLAPRWLKLADEGSRLIRAAIPEPRTDDLWSTYASIVEERLGIFHPREDYIIHALGDERAVYISEFAKRQPAFVQTMRRDQMLYEEWLQTTTWGFYERLLDNYEPALRMDFSEFWRRTGRMWREPSSDGGKNIPLPLDVSAIDVPAGPASANLAIVRVEYETETPFGELPVIGRQARFLVAMPGSRSQYPASLPPHSRVHEFPVPLNPGQPFQLEFQIHGLAPEAELILRSITVRYRTVPKEFLKPS